jgi:hypothetical protein
VSLVGTPDESGAKNCRSARELLFGFALAQDFQCAVVLAAGGQRIRVYGALVLENAAIFVGLGIRRRIVVDGDRGDERVMPRALSHDLAEAPHPLRAIGGEIDHGVPVAIRERFEIAVAIPDQSFYVRRKIDRCHAATEDGDVMAAGDGRSYVIWADVAGSAEYQQA